VEATQFDLVGQVLAGIGMAGLIMGLSSFGRGALPPSLAIALTGVGLVAALGYLRHARRYPYPLLDVSLLKIPTFAVSVSAGSLFRIGIGALPFLLPLMLQIGFGLSAFHSGLVTFVSAAGALVTKPVARPALQRFGFRNLLGWNAAISAVVLALTAAFRPSWPLAAIYGVLLLGGVFRSLQFTAYNTVAYADIPEGRMSSATSFYSTLQQLSLTIGVTLGAAALGLAGALAGKPHPRLEDFSFAFLVVATVMLPAAFLAFRLPANAGAEMSGHAGR
jgi:MFS family permease